MINFFDMKIANSQINFSKVLATELEKYEFSLGSAVKNFEKSFSNYIGVNYCVGVANGTEALELALITLGVKSGDNVATIANAGFYSSTAILSIGANPIYVEINEEDLLIDIEHLENELSKNNITAVVITHTFGQIVNISKIKEITKKFGVKILEDCSHSHGGSINNKKVGSFGDIAAFSFYPTKNLGAIGDGGAVVTNSAKYYENLLKLRQYGWNEKYKVSIKYGRNSRLDSIQAAVLIKKLEFLDQWNLNRVELSKVYKQNLRMLPIKLLDNEINNPPHLYVIRTSKRTKLINYLRKKNIITQIHYPIPDHKQKIINKNFNNLKVTEKNAKKVLSLPLYPNMKETDQEAIIESVISFFN